MYTLPKIGKPAIALGHFPTRYQAFIFRAYEYVPAEKIAEILGTTVEKVISSAREMGLSDPCPDDTWLSRGYITIIRRMWHILPYDQLLRLIGMDEEEFAVRLKEEDFLGKKLGNKPFCEPVVWRELTDESEVAVMARAAYCLIADCRVFVHLFEHKTRNFFFFLTQTRGIKQSALFTRTDKTYLIQ